MGEIAERVGSSKPAVSNRLRLLELPDDVLWMIERGELTEGHARAVLAVPDHEGRRGSRAKIVQEGMSVRAAERAARWAGREDEAAAAGDEGRSGARRAREGGGRPDDGVSSRIVSGRLEIPFADETELEELVEALERAAR